MVFSYQTYLPSALHGVSLIQKKSGDLQAALETIENSIDIILNTKQLHGESAAIMNPLGSAYYRQARIMGQDFQDYEAAGEAFDNSLKIYESLVTQQPTNARYLSKLSSCLSAHAGMLIMQNEFSAALEMLQRSQTAIASAIELNPRNPGYRRSLDFVLAKIIAAQCGMNRPDKAMEVFDSLPLDQLNSQQLCDWAEIAVECLAMTEGQTDLEQDTKEDAKHKFRDCAFKFLISAKKIEGDGLNEVLLHPRFDRLQSDPRFESLVGNE